jgi:hypothetical protein
MDSHPMLLGTRWRKSSYSQHSDSYCVEARVAGPGEVAVRDSKDPDGPHLAFSVSEWTAFITHIASDHS